MTSDPMRPCARVWLWAIVAFCAFVAAIWSARVPFYQQPDEIAHVDYVFALFDAGRPFHVTSRHPAGEVAPQTRFLERGLAYRNMRYNPYARAPAGYGTAAFFRQLDTGAPAPSGNKPRSGSPVPYLMYSYPPAYYVVEAAILSATYKLTGSISAGFFAMRASNVLLLIGTLLLSFYAFRAYRVSERSSLLAVLAIGVFPLISSVSSYVQPDNATTFLIAVVVCAVARGRHDRSCRSDVVALVGLSLLFLVKPHYAFAAWLVTVPLLTFKVDCKPSHPALRFAVAIVPLLIYAVSNRYLNPVSGLESPLAWIERTRGASAASSRSASDTLRLAVDAIGECLGGSVFNGFWFAFGFRAGRIFPHDVLAPILRAVTIFGVATFIIVERNLLKRVWVVATTFERRAAVRLVSSDHPVNLYLTTTAMLLAAHVLSGGLLELEGRYWCAMLLPLALITLRTLPRTLTPNARRNVASSLAVVMAAYSLISGAAAVRAMNDDFYGQRRPQREAVADLLALRASGQASPDAHRLTIDYPQPVHVSGYAIDMLTGYAARKIFVEVDRSVRIRATKCGLPYPDVANVFNDDRVAATRFTLDVPARLLPKGRHRLRFFVGDVARADAIPFWSDAWIDVAENVRSPKSVSERTTVLSPLARPPATYIL